MTGSGTEYDPYLIATVDDLTELSGKSGYAMLVSDIDFDVDGNRGTFSGIELNGELHFNGGGYTINHFYQEVTPELESGGFFRGSFSGSVTDLHFTNAYILNIFSDMKQAGILISGDIKSAVFKNVTISGVITTPETNSYIGAFAPYVLKSADGEEPFNISFERCKVNVNFTGGGLVSGYIAKILAPSGNLKFESCISAVKFLYPAKKCLGFIDYDEFTTYTITLSYTYCIAQIYARDTGDIYGIRGVTGKGSSTAANCAVFFDIIGKGKDTDTSYIYGFTGLDAVLQCYVKGKINNVNRVHAIYAKAVQSYAAIECTDCPTVYAYDRKPIQSFYDSTLMTGNANTYGAATAEQLKSAEWLRKQGWAI